MHSDFDPHLHYLGPRPKVVTADQARKRRGREARFGDEAGSVRNLCPGEGMGRQVTVDNFLGKEPEGQKSGVKLAGKSRDGEESTEGVHLGAVDARQRVLLRRLGES